MAKVKIVTPLSGLAHGTKVFFLDKQSEWVSVEGVVSVSIDPIEAGSGPITARIEVHITSEAIHADGFLSFESLQEAAKFYGLSLVPKNG